MPQSYTQAGFVRAVLLAVNQRTSSAGMGFAGATGLVASGLTDLASVMGPLLPWFILLVILTLTGLSILIRNAVMSIADGSAEPPRLGLYCNVFLVAIGSLFGSGILLATSLFVEQSDGSRILSVLNEIKSGVERVEGKVDTVSEGVEGIGQRVSLRDISGRSGTGKIGDDAIFRISLANENLMDGVSCNLELGTEWQERIEVVNDSCDRFTVRLPDRPLLDDVGNSMGDVVDIPFAVSITDSRGAKIAEYQGAYPIHNNYRTIRLVLDPPGNRLRMNERRKAYVNVENAVIPDMVECDLGNSTNPPISFHPAAANKCEGWLSTEVEQGSYSHRRLMEEGEVRGSIFVQVQSSGDFTMLGIEEVKFAVAK